VVKLTAVSTVGKSPSLGENLFSQQLSEQFALNLVLNCEKADIFHYLLNIYFNIYLFIYAYFFEFFSSIQDFLISS
jgi:hypothetical protein